MPRNAAVLMSIALLALVTPVLAGPAPFGTDWPGSTPELFAPGVVNTDGVEINLVFNQDGTELYFSRTVDKVFFVYTARHVDGAWTAPQRLDLYPDGIHGEAVDMALSPDDQWLYFLGITPEGEGTQSDIWVSRRTDAGWSAARRLGPSVNTAHREFYPTVVADGSLYFVSDRPGEFGPRSLYRATRGADGSFAPAVAIGPPIDTAQTKGDRFVAPDESYLIFSSRDRGGYGSGDLFVSFRTAGGGCRSHAATVIPGRRRPTPRSTGWMLRSSRRCGRTDDPALAGWTQPRSATSTSSSIFFASPNSIRLLSL